MGCHPEGMAPHFLLKYGGNREHAGVFPFEAVPLIGYAKRQFLIR